jgi:hypothetical protein
MVRSTIALLLCLWAGSTFGQNKYFVGLDIGPKFDFNQLSSSPNNGYSPSFDNHNPLAAQFGVAAGIWIEDRWMLEAGLYRSNHQVKFTILGENGERYFANSLVDTYSAIFVPFSLNYNFSPGLHMTTFYGGLGASTLLGVRKGIDRFSSPQVAESPDQPNRVYFYEVENNSVTEGLMTVNAQIGFIKAINEYAYINLLLMGKLGVGNQNFVDVKSTTPSHSTIQNSVISRGSGILFNIGFRYILNAESEE